MYGLSRSGIKASQAPETRRAVSARGVFVRRRRHAMFWPLPTGMPTAAGRRCPEQSTCRVVCVAHFDLKNDKLGAYIHLKRYSHEHVNKNKAHGVTPRRSCTDPHPHPPHTVKRIFQFSQRFHGLTSPVSQDLCDDRYSGSLYLDRSTCAASLGLAHRVHVYVSYPP